MAPSAHVSLLLTILISTCALISTPAATAIQGAPRPPPPPPPPAPCKPFHPVLGFGDSTSDTGNAVRTGPGFSPASKAPYGETFFKKPTGRFSDGRLMVDFLCAALNVPFLRPHLAPPPTKNSSSSSANENFAVAGATALDVATLKKEANVTSFTPDSLGVQLGWFKNDTAHLNLSHALVYFGEIGGNDYNYALGAQRPPKVVAALIPSVIKEIAAALDQILTSGVKKVVVQGEFPMGCISLYMKVLNNTPHDKHGCIKSVMQVSDRHNVLLREAVANASAKHPHAEIVFFDTSAAYVHIMDNAAKYGFINVKDPCYTGGLTALLSSSPAPAPAPAPSSHHGTGHKAAPMMNATAPLPAPPVMNTTNATCPNPRNYIGWDGVHLTDAMYGTLMNLFLTNPKFSSPFPNFLTAAGAGHNIYKH